MRFGASAVLVESTIADCATRDSLGGGAYVEQANLTLQGGSRVERCLADYGGGLLAWEADVALLEGSVLSECHANTRAGGLRARLVAHVERAVPTHTGAGECLLGGHRAARVHRACSLGGCPAKAKLAALGPNLLRFANHSYLWNSRGRMMESSIVNCTADGCGGLYTDGREGSFLATDSVRASCSNVAREHHTAPKVRSHATLAGLRRL